MKLRTIVVTLTALALTAPSAQGMRKDPSLRGPERIHAGLPAGFQPAVLRAREPQRYLVQMRAPAVAARKGVARANVLGTQAPAIHKVRAMGGSIVMRFSTLVNGFSAVLTADQAARVGRLPQVASVSRAAIMQPGLTSSVPAIGAPQVWNQLHARGQGITVGVIDSGVDYTHAGLGGSGSVAEYDANDPTVIEPGTFPTAKVVGGWDFVGDLGYDANDPLTSPAPDPDPLDNVGNGGGHGSHVSGICCGTGVTGLVGSGVAPKAKIFALKVFDIGSVTSDIVIEAMERAADPNEDGDTADHLDVINMSLGSPYTVSPLERAAVKAATQAGIVVVTSAGNEGNQPNGGPAYVTGSPGNSPAAISVAASIDEFTSPTISTNPSVTFPDLGPITVQEWGGGLPAEVSGDVSDAREFSPPVDPSGEPAAADRALCDATPAGTPFAGKIVLVFKGPFAEGDCLADDKALHAQEAGAAAVVLWDGFGGLPSQFSTGTSAASVTIPVVSLSGDDSAALAAAVSPDAPDSYNTATVVGTLNPTPSLIPGFERHMTDFTSEGPSRVTSALKPDVTAPGFNIESVSAGTGDQALSISGTSMASPHVAGLSALLVQLHPNWKPADVKAALMNHGSQHLKNFDGSGPVPATIIGAGQVRSLQSAEANVLASPGSVSYGVQAAATTRTVTKKFRVRNLDGHAHSYRVTSDVRYSDLSAGFATVSFSVHGSPFATDDVLVLPAHSKAAVSLRLRLDPGALATFEQQLGWYYFHPNVDGNVSFNELGSKRSLHVPWHVAGLGASDTDIATAALDLRGGPQHLSLTEDGVGQSGGDLYLLGDLSPLASGGEEDIAAIGARSFTGNQINGIAQGVPPGTDDFAGITWRQFLSFTDVPTEPVEFGVQTYGVRSTTETVEIDVLVDLGADGVYADTDIGADTLVVKLSGPGGLVCVFNLPSTFEACDAEYFADYSNFNTTVTGLVVDATALGLSNATPTMAYAIEVCDLVDADVALCDDAGFDGGGVTYGPVLNVTDPALAMSNTACGGFWGGAACVDPAFVTVATGSAAPGDNPSILALFSNNAPGSQAAIVTTQT